jgi:DNA polymerase-3 subunit beta
MKLSIAKTELQKGLARIQAIVDKRNSMPILANVMLEATEGESGALQISATDLEVGIQSRQAAEVQEAGGLTVSAKTLYEIIRELPDEIVHLKSTANAFLSIQCERSQFKLAGTSPEEYPTLPEFSPEHTVTVPSNVLATMVERTMYAASTDETRYNLNGVYLEVDSDTNVLRLVATDGHRLAMVENEVPGELSALQSGVIIPRKGLAELKRLLDEDMVDEVDLAFEGNSGLARGGEVTLVMRLIEGEFPNYQQVIPSESTVQVIVDSERLSRALRRVVLLSSQRSRAVKLELGDRKLAVSSNNPDMGDARDELDNDYAGEAISIGFNARYMLDALAALQVKEVWLGLNSDLSPAKVKPTNDEGAVAVVMPMRL